MSAGYASRLKEYPNKGICGLPEKFESKRTFDTKLKKLTNFFQTSKHIVFLTGAGISTSAGIPDFRGPKGIWTVEKNQKKKKRALDQQSNSEEIKRKKPKKDEDEAHETSNQKTSEKDEPVQLMKCYKPTYTHEAITKLIQSDYAKFCITQNVDGLHRRTNLSRSKLSILHGCLFTEKCDRCDTEYFRDFDVGGVSFQRTGRQCTKCEGDLRDTILDWDDALPEADYERAQEECEKSDLVVCLGTSLRIQPASELPHLGQKYVIVNLQVTPHDKQACLVIRSKVDDVMRELLTALNLE